MNMLPDEPLWLLDDGDSHTAHATVIEAMQWLQEQHPTFHSWRIDPDDGTGARLIRCMATVDGDNYPGSWTVRRA